MWKIMNVRFVDPQLYIFPQKKQLPSGLNLQHKNKNNMQENMKNVIIVNLASQEFTSVCEESKSPYERLIFWRHQAKTR